MENKSEGQKLREKYKEKIDILDARMKELESLPFDNSVYKEMINVMTETNKYLRAMGVNESEMYDI